MDTFFLNWIMLVGIFSVALASPGPDFVMAVRNSVLYSRRTGIMTAIGFGLGVGVHVTYCLGGLAIIISKSVMLFSILKFIGAAYLFYVGWKALKSTGFSEQNSESADRPAMSDFVAIRGGFITNVFNPKATMFFLALFTQILNPSEPLSIQFLYGLTCIVMTIIWFSVVATVLTAPAIRAQFLKISKWIDRVCGALFIALGFKLVLTKI
jgi:RhtB (resistance to homoserine/threonine) family protein